MAADSLLWQIPTPPDTDVAINWLAQLIPADGNSAFLQALALFSAVLLQVGGASMGWGMLVATIATAHEGKVLGQKYHLIFAPVRITLGLALLAPVGGLGIGQNLVLHLAKSGSALASYTWTSFVDTITTGATVTVMVDGKAQQVTLGTLPSPKVATAGQVVRWLYEHESCMAAVAHILPPGSTTKLAGGAQQPLTPPPAGGIASDKAITWDYGAACGRMALDIPTDDTAAAQFAKARAAAIADAVSELRGGGIMDAVIASASDAAQPPMPSGVAKWLDSIANRMDKATTVAAAIYLATRDHDNRQRLRDGARAGGWVEAGAYWRALSALSAAISAETSKLPTDKGVNANALESVTYGDGPAVAVGMAYAKTIRALETEAKAGQAAKVTVDDLTSADDKSGMLAQIFGPMLRWASEWALTTNDTTDPTAELMALGHGLIDAAWATFLGGTGVAMLAGNMAGSAIGLQTAFGWLATGAGMAIGVMMACGIVLALILPALPFIWLAYAAVGWLLAVVEAMVATPVWLVMLCRWDGSEVIDGPQRTGAILIYNLVLRPTLTVLSLEASYYVLPITVGWLRREWATAYLGQQGGYLTGLVTTLVGLAMLTYLSFKLSTFVLQQVAQLPDRIAAWFGLPASAYSGREEGGNAVGIIGGAHGAASKTESLGHRLGGKSGGGDGGGHDDGGEIGAGRGPAGSIRRVTE